MLSSYIENSFIQLEKNSKHLLINSAKYVLAHDVSKEPLTRDRLVKIASTLNINHIFIINENGVFIRSTNEDPSLIPNLFSFSNMYSKLLKNKYPYLETPIIPPTPEYYPYKFVTIANKNRKRLIEVGIRVDFIGNVITKIIQSNKGIHKIELYGPSGVLIGRFGPGNQIYKRDKIDSSLLEVSHSFSRELSIFIKKIFLDSKYCAQCSGGTNFKYHYYLKITVDNTQLNNILKEIKKNHFLTLIETLFLAILFSFLFSKKIVGKIIKLNSNIQNLISSENQNPLISIHGKDEISNLGNNFNNLLLTLKKHQETLIAFERESTVAKISRQVAHDIRSPLAALDMILKDMSDIPEAKRVLIRNSAHRIHDIANELISKNNLLDKNKRAQINKKPTPYLLSPAIESIISEKRVQYKMKSKVSIEGTFAEEAYGLFSKLNKVELKRILSNLIDNSVESFIYNNGSIIVSLFVDTNNNIVISIADNGKGIPPPILKLLSIGRTTYDKENGSGLGLFHAKEKIQQWGGELEINSQVNVGTKISLSLPQATPPKSFVPILVLEENSKVIIIDDDQAIHDIWDARIKEFKKYNIKTIHFTDPVDFKTWHKENTASVYLIDFEYLGSNYNGIKLIQENFSKSTKGVFLVTSRFEEEYITHACSDLGIGLIPKSQAYLIPIRIIKVNDSLPQVIFIDDDEHIRLLWKIQARSKGINLILLKTRRELFDSLESFHINSTFYIDSNLGNNIKGEDIARELYTLGYRNLILATGYEAKKFKDLTIVKKIIGKEPPF